MNRSVLKLAVLLSFGISYISASMTDFAAVDISYTYCNDPASRAVGLVPVRLHESIDELPYTLTLKVCFYGTNRSVEQILDVVIDNFDLNEFSTLHLCVGSEEVSADHTFTLAELSSIGSLSIGYRIEDNTQDSLKNRHIFWMVDQQSGKREETSESWMKTRMVSAFAERNYLDENGRLRSFRQLRELVNNQ